MLFVGVIVMRIGLGGFGLFAAGDFFDAGHDLFGAIDGGGIGQLHVEDQIALVLLRDEAGRGLDELPAGQHQQAAVDDADNDAQAQDVADGLAVDRRSCLSKPRLKPRKNQPRPALTGRMVSQPSSPPTSMPGMK